MADTKYVVFRLADEHYGIDIEAVERILNEQKTTRIPRTPKMLLGVFDLRGETIPAVDLRARFEFSEHTGASNYIVAITPQGRVALRVDAVEGILNFDDDQIDASPEMLKTNNDEFFEAVAKNGDQLVVLLNPHHILPTNLHKTLEKQNKKSPELVAA